MAFNSPNGPVFDYTIQDDSYQIRREREYEEYFNNILSKRVLIAPATDPWPTIPRLSLATRDDIIEKILSFFTYLDLVILNAKFIQRYRLHPNLGDKCPIWYRLKLQLRKSKNLSFQLHEGSLYEPEQFYNAITTFIDPTRILGLDICASFNFDRFMCPLAGFQYDFRTLVNLKYLTVRLMPLYSLTISYTSLVYVRLMQVFREYAPAYETTFNELCQRAINLQHLEIDEVPHLHDATTFPSLTHITYTSHHDHAHTVRELLFRCLPRLESVTFDLSIAPVSDILQYFYLHNTRFPDISIIKLNILKIMESRKYHPSAVLRISHNNFPNLSFLCCGITGRLDVNQYIDIAMLADTNVIFMPIQTEFVPDELNGQIFAQRLRELSKSRALVFALPPCHFRFLNRDFHKTVFDSHGNIVPFKDTLKNLI